MSDYLCISIHFLDGAFHGRADYGEPEWPPSPLRVFQAIVAASAARWNERRGVHHAAPALRWFERLPNPVIITPPPSRVTASGYRLYVPDNVGDLVGKSWSRGGETNVAGYRTEKTVRPTLFRDEEAVHYLWPLTGAPDGFAEHRDNLFAAVRSVTHVGWGVDLVVAEASVLNETDAAGLKGLRFFPTNDDTDPSLRVPQDGTLEDLENRHHAFLNRVSSDGFAPVPPLATYGIANYRSESEPPRAPRAVFALRKLDDSGFRPFDTARRGLHAAGMLRHAASRPEFARSVGWTDEEARRIVLGHGEVLGQQHQPVQGSRLAFLPLPSIEWRGNERKFSIGSVRRVVVTAVGAMNHETFRRFVRQFTGQELVDEKSSKSVALLAKQPENDGAIKAYFQPAETWATVTPVILPGYDDPRKLRQRLRVGNTNLTAEEKSTLLQKLDKRIEFLLRKAIRQAGFSDALAQYADLEWRSTGFFPGTELASRYAVPEQHRRYRRLHVRITWRRSSDGRTIQVPGPICIGGGKFSGLGLFARVSAA